MNFDLAISHAVQSIYQWGGSAADWLFASFSFLGEETLLFAVICSLYWALDKRLGEYLIFSLYAAVGSNGLLKDMVRRPRPFQSVYASSLRYVQVDNLLVNTVGLGNSFSFPSGHSQAVSAIITSFMVHFKKRWLYLLGGLTIVAVMCSRIYLGVHYATDTIVGAALGIVCALGVGLLLRKFPEKRLWLFGVLVALTALSLVLEFSSDTVKTVGVGVGALLGMLLDDRVVHFSTQGTPWRKVLRVVLGMAVLITLRTVLKVIFPKNLWFDGLRYALVGFAGMGLWPLAFSKAKWM
ncbi:MAG: phosphatase PAP2 family protein [Eubacteriales bacterium]|nr:phosphatase PAP2 family protein [Eubacteriales bacterium]